MILCDRGHWVAFVANKLGGLREYILMDSDNQPILSFRNEAILNAHTKEAGLKARLKDQLGAVDLICKLFEGEVRIKYKHLQYGIHHWVDFGLSLAVCFDAD